MTPTCWQGLVTATRCGSSKSFNKDRIKRPREIRHRLSILLQSCRRCNPAQLSNERLKFGALCYREMTHALRLARDDADFQVWWVQQGDYSRFDYRQTNRVQKLCSTELKLHGSIQCILQRVRSLNYRSMKRAITPRTQRCLPKVWTTSLPYRGR
jgi:hypothetical protein